MGVQRAVRTRTKCTDPQANAALECEARCELLTQSRKSLRALLMRVELHAIAKSGGGLVGDEVSVRLWAVDEGETLSESLLDL